MTSAMASAMASAIDVKKYAKVDGNFCEIEIPLDNNVTTDGTSLWGGTVKTVRLTRIDICLELTPSNVGDDYMFSSMDAIFDTKTWNTRQDGLIYTDDGFLKEFRNILINLGFDQKASMDVDYSEQGMQGDSHVSFDAYELADHVRELLR